MYKSKVFAILSLMLGFFALSVSEAGQAMAIKPDAVPAYRPKYFPFESGEKAVYLATWNGMVSVATAEVYTTPTVVDGRKVYQVRVEAKSSKMLDFIWRMRDTISSTFDAKVLTPSRFTFSQRENSRIIDTDARFDHAAKRWAVNRQQVGKRAKVYHFYSSNTLDPITASYLARATEFKVGDKLYFKVFGGRYQYLLELSVEAKEPVTMASGKTVEAYRIVPQVENITNKGYANRLNDAAIWISADERRLPIKLSSKIIFGSVYLDLVEDKMGTQATAAREQRPAS
ncbi:MAG: DUF3108 domain-containing protein [Chloroflexota bacterium]